MMIILAFLALVLLLHWRDFFIDIYKSEPSMSNIITAPTQEEALAAMNEYAELQAHIEKVESQKKLDLMKVENKYSERLADMTTRRDDLEQVVFNYVQANRDQLFDGKKKSTAFGVGTVGVKLNRAKLELVDGATWDGAMKYWKKVNPDYVRMKEDLDKTSILKAFKDAEGDDLAILQAGGLQIIQEEEVYIKI